jgi:hypothetical protein
VCISNAEEPDEDEAVVYVGNVGSSVSQAGWMPGQRGVWAATDMETFSVWSDEARNATIFTVINDNLSFPDGFSIPSARPEQ